MAEAMLDKLFLDIVCFLCVMNEYDPGVRFGASVKYLYLYL